jgi:pimeloyl-ACP methyl ester carboxylesterase
MNLTRLTINNSVEGKYADVGYSSPLVIIVNGHNGFYNYGMFPYIQQQLFDAGISSFSFNFSHGGVVGDSDIFEDLEGYEKNCIRLEVSDVLAALQHKAFEKHPGYFLLAHSLGGVPAIFAGAGAEEILPLKGLILLNSVSTLNFWPPETIEEWKKTGVLYIKNNRTKQDLPMGKEFLQEILDSDAKWNVEKMMARLTLPILVIHGDADESVPISHGRSLYESGAGNNDISFITIEGASHTFNTKHPFEGPSQQLDKMLSAVISWITRHIG